LAAFTSNARDAVTTIMSGPEDDSDRVEVGLVGALCLFEGRDPTSVVALYAKGFSTLPPIARTIGTVILRDIAVSKMPAVGFGRQAIEILVNVAIRHGSLTMSR
jgi:hypothetical protein